MVKYVEGSFDEDYIQTLGWTKRTFETLSAVILMFLHGLLLQTYRTVNFLGNIFAGVNFMEKTVAIRNTDVTFSIWDLGGLFLYSG